MKDILLQYTKYNLWANLKIGKLLEGLTTDQVHQSLGGSFDTIRKTTEHILMAEDIWWQRLCMQEHVAPLQLAEDRQWLDILQQWKVSSEHLLQFTEKIMDDRGCLHQFHYTNLAGEAFKITVWECIQHVCNHSTFHRGQLVNYGRSIGLTKIPSTDFITFSRERN